MSDNNKNAVSNDLSTVKDTEKSEQREANSESRKSEEKRDWRVERWVARSQQRAIRNSFYPGIEIRGRAAEAQGAQLKPRGYGAPDVLKIII